MACHRRRNLAGKEGFRQELFGKSCSATGVRQELFGKRCPARGVGQEVFGKLRVEFNQTGAGRSRREKILDPSK
jgi:hypothetical protein